MTAQQVRAFEPDVLRRVMGHVPTGVSVVTGLHEGQPVGLAVGSFVSVSLEPPLVGFLVDHGSTSWPRNEQASRFVVNLLAEHDESTCRKFARSGGTKFTGVGWRSSGLGSPVIDDALAWFDCTLYQRLPAGDHWFVLGAVADLSVRHAGRPLVFYRGGYTRLGAD